MKRATRTVAAWSALLWCLCLPLPAAPPTESGPDEAPARPAPPPKPIKVLPDGRLDITFDHLKFDIEKGAPFRRELLTPEIERLDGKQVRLRGWILPTSVFRDTNNKAFVLVRDNMECCFGPGAAIYDCVNVEMTKGHGADFSTRPVAVDGLFTITEFLGPDGELLAIYHMDADSAK